MNNEQLEKRIYDYIKANAGTSFVEIEDEFQRLGYDWQGDKDIRSGEFENMIFWLGWNAETVAAMIKVLMRSDIKIEAVSSFIYVIDGNMLEMPLAKRQQDYKEPHWAPVVLSVV